MNQERTTCLLTTSPTRVRWVFDLFNLQRLHPLYENPIQNKITGKNYGLAYKFDQGAKKNSFFKVYDLPDYLMAKPRSLPKNLSLKAIRQYQGFLTNLSSFDSLDTFLAHQLSKRSRKRLRKAVKELHEKHSISKKMFFGHIEKKEHQSLMKRFAFLLKKRFDEKKTFNRYLGKWHYYEQLSFEKINEGKASLFVTYSNKKPICLTLNFHFNDILFSELECFDVEYSQYGLGDISMLEHINWCFENDVKLIDLAMGRTPFKIKWSNYNYHFHHHIYFKKGNPGSYVRMLLESLKLSLWQMLRDIGLVGNIIKSDKILFLLRRRMQNQKS